MRMPRVFGTVGVGSVLLALMAHRPAVAAASVPSEACDLYVAALQAVASDSGTVVVLDSTYAGIPRRVFHAYSGVARPPAAQGVDFPDSVRRAFAAVNTRRAPLAACLTAPARVELLASDSLAAMFRGGDGWAAFRGRYPTARGFLAVSQPLVATDSQSAVVYVVTASGWLAGSGRLVRFERDRTRRWVRRAEAFLWMS
jgi:hypothetical protein